MPCTRIIGVAHNATLPPLRLSLKSKTSGIGLTGQDHSLDVIDSLGGGFCVGFCHGQSGSVLSRWRMQNDPQYRLHSRLNTRISDVFKKQVMVKSARTTELIDAEIADFKAYLSANWEEGMSWDNLCTNSYQFRIRLCRCKNFLHQCADNYIVYIVRPTWVLPRCTRAPISIFDLDRYINGTKVRCGAYGEHEADRSRLSRIGTAPRKFRIHELVERSIDWYAQRVAKHIYKNI